MAFKDTLSLVKQSIGNLMTKEEISDRELNDLTELTKQVDELGKQHQELVDSHNSMKDKYIESLTKTGTSELPKNGDELPKGRTLEEIAKDILANSK